MTRSEAREAATLANGAVADSKVASYNEAVTLIGTARRIQAEIRRSGHRDVAAMVRLDGRQYRW
jgi:hypothetical protein